LRRLRERTGLTGDEVAAQLGWSGSKVSRIELHRTGIKQADLRKLMDLYGVDESHRGELQALARESRQTDRLERVAANFPPEYAAYLQAEAEAESIWNWEPQVVPGLLQTRDYARAVMRVWHAMFPVPPGEVERRLDAGAMRQQFLTKDPPLELLVVIDESVLHRRFGDASVMHGQLERLLKAAELPNVEVRVVRLDGEAPLVTGAFSYIRFPRVHKVPLHDIVSVEHLEGNHYFEDEEQTYSYMVAFEHVRDRALSPEDSSGLISEIAKKTWT
jgi:transcriptional regulator with XRE-family HTH domain